MAPCIRNVSIRFGERAGFRPWCSMLCHLAVPGTGKRYFPSPATLFEVVLLNINISSEQ